MTPLTETISDTIRVAVSKRTFLTFSTSTPRLLAVSSPNKIKFKSLAKILKTTITPNAAGATIITLRQSAVATLPMVHITILASCSRLKVIIKEINAVNKILTAVPVNNSVTAESRGPTRAML